MSTIADSRSRVLGRIRAATGAAGAESAERNAAAAGGKATEGDAEIARDYVRRGELTVSARHERFIERLREYDAEVVECEPDAVAAAIAEQLAASGRRTFVAPAGLPKGWLAEGFEWRIDGNSDLSLGVRDVEQVEGVVTGCFCGVAESGTIVLHHSASEGRRVLTLLPDWHLCVVRGSQVVETLPEYFDKCREQATGNREQKAGELPRLVTWISGPSATADIEMTRIKGVHGPRFLHVVFVRD